MRVPVSSPQKSSSISSNTTPSTLCYEPTSVLDLRSPVADKNPTPNHPKANSDALIQPSHNNPQLDWKDDHVIHNLDWDSIMKDLGLQEDINNIKNKTTCEPQLPEFPTTQFVHHTEFFNTQSELYSNQGMNIPLDMSNDFLTNWPNNSNLSLDFVEELIRAADLFESNEIQLVQVVLTRLNNSIPAPIGKPLQRVAFYFKEALQFILTGFDKSHAKLTAWHDIVQTIKAHNAFSAISPVPMFSHFTANQALLEAFHNSMIIHVIDFDIGLGGQYASFMRELAERAEPCRVLRITAIVHEDYTLETKLVRENLTQFAYELKLRFHIEFIPVQDFNTFSFKSVKFMQGEKTAVLLSQTIFQRLGSTDNGVVFVDSLRRISPSVVLFIDNDGWVDGGGGTVSFKRHFVSSLEFYTMMFESLDVAAGGVSDWVRNIEEHVLRPNIFAAVEGAARRAAMAPSWREVFHGAGMRAVQLSKFADFQAECLLGKVQVRGFQVAKRQAELVLCWHERDLVTTSAWKW